MQDRKLREAFRALVRHLNLRVDDYFGYEVKNNPSYSGCNIARREDIRRLQEQIDELKPKQKKIKSKK